MIGLHALAAQAVGYGGARLLAAEHGRAPARDGRAVAAPAKAAALRAKRGAATRVARRSAERGGAGA